MFTRKVQNPLFRRDSGSVIDQAPLIGSQKRFIHEPQISQIDRRWTLMRWWQWKQMNLHADNTASSKLFKHYSTHSGCQTSAYEELLHNVILFVGIVHINNKTAIGVLHKLYTNKIQNSYNLKYIEYNNKIWHIMHIKYNCNEMWDDVYGLINLLAISERRGKSRFI